MKKKPRNRLPECLKPKKQTLSLKKQFCFKKSLYKNSYDKNATEPSSKMPEAKKPTLSFKKEFCFKKADKFIWKKATEPSSRMPEAKKTNTFIEKTILFQKKLI